MGHAKRCDKIGPCYALARRRGGARLREPWIRVHLTDQALLDRTAELARTEQTLTAQVVAHIAEVDRRRLYRELACPSLFVYCHEILGYSEDAAYKRMRVARAAWKYPAVQEALVSGKVHLAGLCLLAPRLTEANHQELIAEASGKSKRDVERLIAARFPQPDTPARVTPTGDGRYRVEFTATERLMEKVQRARDLTSHAIPDGDLATLFERAIDELIAREQKRAVGTGKRPHIPQALVRAVRERDGDQCSFLDQDGHRCPARTFLHVEHKQPYARGGPATLDNLCLLCAAHNQLAAEKAYGKNEMAKYLTVRDAATRPGASWLGLPVRRGIPRALAPPE